MKNVLFHDVTSHWSGCSHNNVWVELTSHHFTTLLNIIETNGTGKWLMLHIVLSDPVNITITKSKGILKNLIEAEP